MKYKFPIITSFSVVSVIIVLFFVIPLSENSVDVSPSDHEQYISAKFAPSVYVGVNRNYDFEVIKLLSEDFKDISTIETMFDYALNVTYLNSRDDPIFSGLTIIDDSNKYFLIKIGPQLVKVENYMSEKEFNQYQLWADEHLVGYENIFDNSTSYSIKYEDEVFFDIEFN